MRLMTKMFMQAVTVVLKDGILAKMNDWRTNTSNKLSNL